MRALKTSRRAFDLIPLKRRATLGHRDLDREFLSVQDEIGSLQTPVVAVHCLRTPPALPNPNPDYFVLFLWFVGNLPQLALTTLYRSQQRSMQLREFDRQGLWP